MKNSRGAFAGSRAIMAVFLETTLGYFFGYLALILLLISIALAYIAINEASLLWILATLTIMLFIWSLVLFLITRFAVSRILPRPLKRLEKRFIKEYVGFLRKRLTIEKTPVVLFAWRLIVHSLKDQNGNSPELERIDKEIDASRRLSEGFKTIRSYFGE